MDHLTKENFEFTMESRTKGQSNFGFNAINSSSFP